MAQNIDNGVMQSQEYHPPGGVNPLFNPLTFTPQQSASLINNPGVITPQTLNQTNPLAITDPLKVPVTDPNSLYNTPPLTLTPQEQQQSDLNTKQAGLNNQMIGKSAYQTQENTAFGVDTAQKNINDLTAQLTGLKNEAAAIPLQFQQNNAGQTINVGNAQMNASLRTNAIAALGISTLLAASQGQLANAQALADKAVAQKYDPIQEQINANKANLELIKNDPATSLADKNRADKQLAIQKQKADQVAEAKKNDTDVWKVATDAASNISDFKPTADYKTASQALTAISKATSAAEALQIAIQTGMVKQTNATPKILGSASSGYFSYDPNTGVSTPLGGTAGGSGGGSSSGTKGFNSLATNLQKQAIPTKALNKNGTLQATYKKTLIDSGVPAVQVDWLWNAVTSGTSFEEIRKEIIKGNGNPKVLDTFVTTLQS